MSRELMKEFRTLRDLRHDNINSFIGEFFCFVLHSCLVLLVLSLKWEKTECRVFARHFDVN